VINLKFIVHLMGGAKLVDAFQGARRPSRDRRCPGTQPITRQPLVPRKDLPVRTASLHAARAPRVRAPHAKSSCARHAAPSSSPGAVPRPSPRHPRATPTAPAHPPFRHLPPPHCPAPNHPPHDHPPPPHHMARLLQPQTAMCRAGGVGTGGGRGALVAGEERPQGQPPRGRRRGGGGGGDRRRRCRTGGRMKGREWGKKAFARS